MHYIKNGDHYYYDQKILIHPTNTQFVKQLEIFIRIVDIETSRAKDASNNLVSFTFKRLGKYVYVYEI